MTDRVADLHTHSLFSDGSDAPAEVVRRAHAAGLDAIALTDHDTLDGLPDAAAAAAACGLEVIPGIEISCTDGAHEIHLLAYWIDPAHAALRGTLQRQQAGRLRRLDAMLARLGEHGAVITREQVLAQAGHGSVGRPHVARALMAAGIVRSLEEAFKRFLGDRAPCFVRSSELASAEAIRLVRDAGGVPVLAHPTYLYDDTAIERLVGEGVAGIEAYHSSHTPSVAERYAQLAGRLGVLVTGGSDYHGANKDEGTALGRVRLPYRFVEALQTWRLQHSVPS